jgi:hypothetical protein
MFFTPEDGEKELAKMKRNRQLSEEEKKDLYRNYTAVKRAMPNRAGHVLKITRFKNSQFRDFLRWSLQNGYEKGKVLMPRPPISYPNMRYVPPHEFNEVTEAERQAISRCALYGFFTAPCPGETLFYFDEFFWTSVAGAKRSAMGIGALNARGREVAKSRRKTEVMKLKAFGKSKTVARWAQDPRARASDKTIRKRIKAGWAPEEAITTPRAKGGRPPR